MSDTKASARPSANRTVFFVSDGTGITAETFGHSVLTQFDLKFKQIRLPFIDTIEKAFEAVRKINDAFDAEGNRPIVFSTLVQTDLASVIFKSKGLHMDLIQTFVAPLEQELGIKSTHTVGRSHNIADTEEYKNRIEAIIEAFSSMQQEVEKEKRYFANKWARDEKNIRQVIDSTYGMHGDLRGILAASIPQISGLDLEMIEGGEIK